MTLGNKSTAPHYSLKVQKQKHLALPRGTESACEFYVFRAVARVLMCKQTRAGMRKLLATLVMLIKPCCSQVFTFIKCISQFEWCWEKSTLLVSSAFRHQCEDRRKLANITPMHRRPNPTPSFETAPWQRPRI